MRCTVPSFRCHLQRMRRYDESMNTTLRGLLVSLTVACLVLASLAARPAQQSEADQKLISEIRMKAQGGDAQSQFQLGKEFFGGGLVLRDQVEAAKWFRAAAEQNHALAQSQLGFQYMHGEGVAKDNVEGAKWFHKAADQHEVTAQYTLGLCYDSGIGVHQDDVEAAKWYRRAAEQLLPFASTSVSQARCALGYLYSKGDGVAKDEVEAAKWYRAAADLDLDMAQHNLACCYQQGQGVARDEVEAAKWFRKAAAQNYVDAQLQLGNCYALGAGVAKDEVEAAKWFRAAAEQNSVVAQHNLANCYLKGRGVARDEAEAVKWFRKAAAQNLAEAQNNLGVCYTNGDGVLKDEVEGYKWFLLAASQGSERAKRKVSAVETWLTRQQIAEGQKLAREFKPSVASSSVGGGASSDSELTRSAVSGTGFFITADGYFVTNAHVIKGSEQIRLVTTNGMISAKLVKVDAVNDLALLKAEGTFKPLPVASSRSVKLGGTVATVGFPNIGLQGFSPKLSKGEIASLAGAGDDPRYFQISVPVQPGNSGGALVDERGNVVGVVAAKLNAEAALASAGALPENVNYAVKSSFLLSFLESMPEVSDRLRELETSGRKFEDVVRSVEQATVLVVVY